MIYWCMLAYIMAALVWWFIALSQQNKELVSIRISELNTSDIQYDQKYKAIIKEENIKNFNAKRKMRLNARDYVIKGVVPNSYDYHMPESQVSDEDKTTNWVVLNELRNLSQKIDYVKVSIEKIVRRKEGR